MSPRWSLGQSYPVAFSAGSLSGTHVTAPSKSVDKKKRPQAYNVVHLAEGDRDDRHFKRLGPGVVLIPYEDKADVDRSKSMNDVTTLLTRARLHPMSR